jgi:hypothetical protein
VYVRSEVLLCHKEFNNSQLFKTHITRLSAHARQNVLSRGAAVASGTFKINHRKKKLQTFPVDFD